MLGIGIGINEVLSRRGGAPTPPRFVLSADTIQEGAAAGTLVGNVLASNGGVITGLSITDTDGNRFALDGSAIEAGAVATDYDTAALHTITLAGNIDGNATTTDIDIFVINVFEVTLNALTLDNDEILEGSPAGTHVANISGKSAGSTLSLIDSAGNQFALDGLAIEAGAVPTDIDIESEPEITIRETHPDAGNSPRDTVFVISVTTGAPAESFRAKLTLEQSHQHWLFA